MAGKGVLKPQKVHWGVSTGSALICTKIQQRLWSPEFLGTCTLCQGCTPRIHGLGLHTCVVTSVPCLPALCLNPKAPMVSLLADMASYVLNFIVSLIGIASSSYPGPWLCPASFQPATPQNQVPDTLEQAVWKTELDGDLSKTGKILSSLLSFRSTYSSLPGIYLYISYKFLTFQHILW